VRSWTSTFCTSGVIGISTTTGCSRGSRVGDKLLLSRSSRASLLAALLPCAWCPAVAALPLLAGKGVVTLRKSGARVCGEAIGGDGVGGADGVGDGLNPSGVSGQLGQLGLRVRVGGDGSMGGTGAGFRRSGATGCLGVVAGLPRGSAGGLARGSVGCWVGALVT